MKVDNQRNTYRIWISRLVRTLVFALVVVLLIFIDWFDNLTTGMTKYHLMIIVAVIYVAVSWINYLKRPYFVSYSDHGEMIVMRYYPLNMFTTRKHSVEIPKKQFVKFELKSFLFGTQHQLILVQNFRNKEAKYPPISLSALDKEDRDKILESLGSYLKQ